MGRAIADFNLIEPGDRILVGVSGGKDSFTLLHLLQILKASAPIDFSLVACNLDQGHPGFPALELERYLRGTGAEVPRAGIWDGPCCSMYRCCANF